MSRIALETLGCKLNQAESEALSRGLAEAGYEIVPGGEQADIYLVNTCTVTHVADRKSRHLLQRSRCQNPGALVIAAGCYARRYPEALASLSDLCLENGDVKRLEELLRERGYLPDSTGCRQSKEKQGRTRSLVKVQEGCSDGCTYCIVPRVRGRPHSIPLHQIVGQVRARLALGYREVTLTGTKLGTYRDGDLGLRALVGAVLKQTAAERVRLSSLQPADITPDFLSLWQDERLCRHFHLPLQSGSEAVLQKMGRSYHLEDFQQAVKLIRDTLPDAAVTTDVIIGFPGESQAAFEEGLRFCSEMGFARTHVFPFSPRPGTAAARMPGQVDARTKTQRKLQMLELAEKSSAAVRSRFVGRTMVVLWEREQAGTWSGLTGNYIRVFASSREDLHNRLLAANLVEVRDGGMIGEI